MDEIKKGKYSTEELFRIILKSPQSFFSDEPEEIQNSGMELFVDYLKRLMSEKDISVNELVACSTLGRSYIYWILSGKRNPSRDVVIMLSLSLGLSLSRTQRMLKLAHKSELYPKIRRDAAIICCVAQGLTVFETNDFLTSVSEDILE